MANLINPIIFQQRVVSSTSLLMLAPHFRNLSIALLNHYHGNVPKILSSSNPMIQQQRCVNGRPNMEWKKERARKVIKIKLPDFDEIRKSSQTTPEQYRTMMKEKGVTAPRYWNERPAVVSCTSGIYDEYVPQEGEGKESLLTLSGARTRLATATGKKGKSFMAIRTIRRFEGDAFDPHAVADECFKIYCDAHKTLCDRGGYGYGQQIDQDKLLGLVTENLYPEMVWNSENKTIIWKLIDTIDKPILSHCRTSDIITKNNTFAQITFRFHTRQILAIYDRHGRLIAGHPHVVKDVLEFCVFEKHIANEYGRWRLHGKIIPKWFAPKEPIRKTYIRPEFEDPGEILEADQLISNEQQEEEEKKSVPPSDSDQPNKPDKSALPA